MALLTDPPEADKPIVFEKADDDNPSQRTSEKNITRKWRYPTFGVEHVSV
jgi:hypothetical protein